MKFIEKWLLTLVTLVMEHVLIQLSGPVGTCKSTLARLIAQTHQVPVVLVDELGKHQKFYLILVDGTTQLLTPKSVLPGDFKVVIANCGTNPKNRPNKKNGTFPAVAATQKLGKTVGSAIASKIKTAIKADAFFKVKTWKLLDALADEFGVAEARKIWADMVFSRPGNSYVQWKTQDGPLTPSQQALALFVDWGKGFQPWSKTVVHLTAPNVEVLNIQPETITFVAGYLDKGVYSLEPPVDVELNKWYGKQMLPVHEGGDVQVGGGNVPHVTLGNHLPFVKVLTFEYRVVLTNSAGEVVGTADYALADGHWYHMTTKASGIPPATLGHRFVKDALEEFASREASGGGVKTE